MEPGTGDSRGARTWTAAWLEAAGAGTLADAIATGEVKRGADMPASAGGWAVAPSGLAMGRTTCLAPTSVGPLPPLSASKSAMSETGGEGVGPAARAREGAAAATGFNGGTTGLGGTAGPPTSATAAGAAGEPMAVVRLGLTNTASDDGRGRSTKPCRCSTNAPPAPPRRRIEAAVQRSSFLRGGRALAVAAGSRGPPMGGSRAPAAAPCSRMADGASCRSSSLNSKFGRVPRSPGRRTGDPRGAPAPSRSGTLVMFVSMTATCWVGEKPPSSFGGGVANAAALFTGARRPPAAPGTRLRRSRWPRSRQSVPLARRHAGWRRAGLQRPRRRRRTAGRG